MEESTYGANKIYYEFKRGHEAPLTEGSTINTDSSGIEPEIIIQLSTWYQGPDFVDPNPPEEVIPDPKSKKAPAKGAPVVPDEPPPPRMITPAPILMSNESGRTFRFELGRFEKEPTQHENSTENIG